MPYPRKNLVDLSRTPYYHCISRCVRRAWLCGEDAHSGRNYDHRRGWVVDRLRELSSIFAIEVCAYAVMSNHFHVVLKVDAERVKKWSNTEIIERWKRLFGLPPIMRDFAKGGSGGMSAGEKAYVDNKLRLWAKRLSDLSWFMAGFVLLQCRHTLRPCS